MTKQTIAAAIFSIVASLTVALPARAGDIIQTLSVNLNSGGSGTTSYYDSTDSYDFISSFPTPGEVTTVGTFTFTIPTDEVVTGVIISGTFGNGDSPTTAESDYFLGDGSDGETSVEVAGGNTANPCDSIYDDCYSNQNGPTPWSYTFTAADLANLAGGLSTGSVDFSYTWINNTELDNAALAGSGQPQYVYAGAPTIDIQLAPTPEPATVLLCLGGLAGIAARRRFSQL